MTTRVVLLALAFIAISSVDCKYNVNKLLKQAEEESNTFNKVSVINFDNCGPNTDPIFLNSLTITPDPFKLPGTVSITANVDFKTNITGPLAMQLKIYKIIGPLKLEIPCVDNVGSCNYADVCTLLPLPTDCPSMFKEQGIPCSCPFLKGNYNGQNLKIEVDLPAKIPQGQYWFNGNLEDQTLGHVFCLDVHVNLA